MKHNGPLLRQEQMDIMLLVGFFGGSYSMGTPYEIPSRYIHVKTATGLLGHSTEGAPAELLPPSWPSSRSRWGIQ